ncbi:30S ribosomal protein S9 [Candidatus Formimonas warabiya]|uniref:30S ribosomal protein S9 n=1 Tax=Formimonas warabiya TaxID=1761012 RepID=A0A3G1L214_FORW1|nr:30S ribosomal protein S9 [Candidatus Formimonas warabiya]
MVNERQLDEYFGKKTLEMIVKQPLELTGTLSRFNVIAKVQGGGTTGQAGAVRHGIARALVQADAGLRPKLKSAGFITRDPRMKERRKYGLKKARKASQFSKR